MTKCVSFMVLSSDIGAYELGDVHACPEEQLRELNAAQLAFGVGPSARSVRKVVGVLALHDGDLPLTRDDFVARTEVVLSGVSVALGFLFSIGATAERKIIPAVTTRGSKGFNGVVRGEHFDEYVQTLPE